METLIEIEEVKRLDAERTQGNIEKFKSFSDCYIKIIGVGVVARGILPNDADFFSAAPRIAAKCIALDEENKVLKDGQLDYHNMVKELHEYCQPLMMGTLGLRHSTNLIADHKRQAEEIKSLKERLDYTLKVGGSYKEEIEQLRADIQSIKSIWQRNYGYLHNDDMRLGFESEMERVFPDVGVNNEEVAPLNYDALVCLVEKLEAENERLNKECDERVKDSSDKFDVIMNCREEASVLRQENERLRGGWLSIESAPKIDRNRVWLWEGKYVFEGSYRVDGDHWVETCDYSPVTPIYWQPIRPQPPINDKHGE